jgi:hypothetical protein
MSKKKERVGAVLSAQVEVGISILRQLREAAETVPYDGPDWRLLSGLADEADSLSLALLHRIFAEQDFERDREIEQMRREGLL